MACYSPIDAWQLEDGKVVFAERGSVRRSVRLPCGQCVGCRLERSRYWAVRCMHESQMHEFSSFITLTYDDAHFPHNGSLSYRDYQLFMKRLRKRSADVCSEGNKRIRFYMAGEYGSKLFRPHYHAILFNVFFTDRVELSTTSSGCKIYRSPLLESLWPFGYSSVGDVSFESAAYVARYCMKKVTGPLADEYYQRVIPSTGEVIQLAPEFAHMSLKPGIGATWFAKYGAEVFPRDFVVSRGVKVKPPKYYYNSLLKKSDGFVFDDVAYDRFCKSLLTAEDSTPQRLAVREEVTLAGLSFKRRDLEL